MPYPRTAGVDLPESVERIKTLYEAGLTQQELAEETGFPYMAIRRVMKQNGIPTRKAAKRDQLGEKNHMWKGEEVGYCAGHERVQKLRGKPSLCEDCGRSGIPCEWANLSGDWGNPSDYRRLCRSCHAKFDDIVSNLRTHGDS